MYISSSNSSMADPDIPTRGWGGGGGGGALNETECQGNCREFWRAKINK